MSYEKVVRNGQVAVLYSPGFGAGWYSWNKDHPACLFHPQIVERVLLGEPVTDEICKRLFGGRFYSGGASGLHVAWLPEGAAFQIEEYDGSEDIELADGKKWLVA